jgi:hypothetical protein
VRFKLTTVFAVTFLIAVVIACFSSPGGYSLRLIGTLTLFMLAFSAIAAVLGENKVRWFGTGFAITGGLIMAGTIWPSQQLRAYLPMDAITNELDGFLHLSKPRAAPTGEIVSLLDNGMVHIHVGGRTNPMTLQEATTKGLAKYGYSQGFYPTRRNLSDIGDWSFVVLAGLLGGCFAMLIRRRADPSK